MLELSAYAPNPNPTQMEAIASRIPRSIDRNQRAVNGCVTNTAAQLSDMRRRYSRVPKPLPTTARGSANWNCQNTIMKAKCVARNARQGGSPTKAIQPTERPPEAGEGRDSGTRNTSDSL